MFRSASEVRGNACRGLGPRVADSVGFEDIEQGRQRKTGGRGRERERDRGKGRSKCRFLYVILHVSSSLNSGPFSCRTIWVTQKGTLL